MNGRNEDKVMDVFFCASVPCDRMKTQHLSLHVVFLVVLLAGLTSATTVSPATPPPENSVFYFLQVTVDVTGKKKSEEDIKSWLENVFKTNLQNCDPVDEYTTVIPTSTQRTFNGSNLPTTQTMEKHSTTRISATTGTQMHNISWYPTTTKEKQTDATTSGSATTKTKTSITSQRPATTNKNTPVTSQRQATTNKNTPVTSQRQATTNKNTPVTSQRQATTNKNTQVTSQRPATTNKNTPVTSQRQATTNKNTPVTSQRQATTNKNTQVTSQRQATTNKNTPVTSQSPAMTNINTPITSQRPATTNENTPVTSQRQATTNRKQTIQTVVQTLAQPTTVETRIITKTQVFTDGGEEIVLTGKSNNGRPKTERKRREIRSKRDTSIQNRNTAALFQGLEVTCNQTLIRDTNCTVTLQLSQQVLPCCLLLTLCTASRASANIYVVGTRANLLHTDACTTDSPEEKVCAYTGQSGASCDVSPSAYGPPQCTVNTQNLTCQGYSDDPVAFYTIQISITTATNSSALSVISSLQSYCPPTNSSCRWADRFKGVISECDGTSTNPGICQMIVSFSGAVPICKLSEAIISLFRSEDDMDFDGRVKRAAVCINSEDSSDLSSIWSNVRFTPDPFCSEMQESFPFSNVSCTTWAAVLQLKEECDATASTTISPNVTTVQTFSSTLNTTAEMLNDTVTSGNFTGNATTPALSKEGQANALLELTKDVSKLNSAQVSQLISALEGLLAGPNISLALGNIAVNIVSNLLDASPEVLADSSSRMNGIVDTVGLKLILTDEAETLLSPSVALSAKPTDGTNFPQTSFSISNPSNIQIRGSVFKDARDSSIAQASITLPSTITQNLTSEQQLLVSRVHFNFYQKNTTFQDSSLGKRRLNSGIVSASVANLSISGLSDDVTIFLKSIEPVQANYESLCVFWDKTLNDGSGGWNQNGCYVRSMTANVTECGCNHLTSFAILLNLARLPVTSRLQATILTFITYIGCGISAIFLAITLLTYLSFGKLRKDIPSKILIQLCLSLLLLNLVFLVDAWLALYVDAVGLCISTAWFLHYFLLVAFTWMGIEAVHMYLALVKVFNTYISRYMVKYSLVGWGVPMLVVIIVIAINKDHYGLVSYGQFDDGTSDDFCWIRNDIAFYVAVVAYFCVIFVFNFIMFLVVLVQLCRIKRQNPHNQKYRTTLQDVRSVTGITVLLGLTWGFAFFAWGPVNLPFMYLFAIFNSLQGFFIFIFHCLVKESVRRQWRTYLCCGRMRLAENSEWSRTATQKTARRSSVTRGTSLPSSEMYQSHNFSNSSSFLVNDSDPSRGIGNPLEDRTIIADEDRSDDVILSETNSQNTTQPTS